MNLQPDWSNHTITKAIHNYSTNFESDWIAVYTMRQTIQCGVCTRPSVLREVQVRQTRRLHTSPQLSLSILQLYRVTEACTLMTQRLVCS